MRVDLRDWTPQPQTTSQSQRCRANITRALGLSNIATSDLADDAIYAQMIGQSRHGYTPLTCSRLTPAFPHGSPDGTPHNSWMCILGDIYSEGKYSNTKLLGNHLLSSCGLFESTRGLASFSKRNVDIQPKLRSPSVSSINPIEFGRRLFVSPIA